MNNTYAMKTRPNILETGTPLFCDLYHLTMAQAWFLDGKAEDYKVSEAFFRKCPFGGSYLMTAGLGEFMQWLERWRFSKEDIESLKNDRNEDGSRIFNDEFLQFLEGQELKVTIRAVPEGELVFPNEPVYSVSGPNWQVELAEAALLNIFNAQSLIATKASRMAYAANLDGKNARCWNSACGADTSSAAFRKRGRRSSAVRRELPTKQRQSTTVSGRRERWHTPL